MDRNLWINAFSSTPEDLEFIKKFIVFSGSLKELSNYYEVSYPTIRNRLNNVIHKIELYEEQNNIPFVQYIKSLVIDGRISLYLGEQIIKTYKKELT
ncbi:DUF2089 domain-containing protein [Staphylococcus warneri]|uniref:DUF2089 family protein n=1 Tax=Staphylococcus TaxID=1279 RepID=UPI00066C1147|nr:MULTISPECIES: DUF2089 family protein [Staphylococcus]MDH8826373.1 DUF2089 family protein [Staphylococcus capitis]MDH8925546.1 DUF2089 family protein [Staphylococcus capitis]MDH9838668.1 DUF2089 family protein [Staphylococcus capitis]MDS3983955.1 DUF2089 family protein [Staphylococcus capitis]MDS3997880.1 DUF2089 family protein [Staphylococcus capitis]